MMALAAPALSEAQQPAANPSRAVATKDAPKINLDGWQMTATRNHHSCRAHRRDASIATPGS